MPVTQILSIGFMMGLVGSLHCVGMCGPIAMALPMSAKQEGSRLTSAIIYNLGRVVSYSWLGLVLGLAGDFIITPQVQSAVSIAFGVGILVYLLLPFSIKRKWFSGAASSKIFMQLRKQLGKLLANPSNASLFQIGMLNGLLPCGMIYTALASSFLTGSAVSGSMFMAAFGAGTLPAMISVVFFGNYLTQRFRFQLRKAVPVFLFSMAALLVLRGLNLGIPYISPSLPVDSAVTEGVCHQ